MAHPKLSEDVVLAIRFDSAAGLTPKQIAAKYGLNRATVYAVTSGVAHADVGGPIRTKRPRLKSDAAPDEIRAEGISRILSRIEISEGGCWRWTGTMANAKGYGGISLAGRYYTAHRLSYELFVGPIPDGYDVDHECHNRDPECFNGDACLHRRCVNPAHLRAVPHSTNVGAGRSWAIHGLKTACPQGHAYDDDNTRHKQLPSGGFARVCRTCSRDYMRRRRAEQREKPDAA